ncbi:MAG: efflux RND transporter periplasmic adaptor subunit [Evtepia sp.]
MTKRTFLTALTLLMLFAFAGCGEAEPTTAEPVDERIAVEVQTVTLGNISTENSISGKIVSEKDTSVYVTLSTRCDDVYVKVGDTVKAGQIICKLDLSTTLDNYEAASLNYENAVRSYDEQSALLNQQVAQCEKNLNDTKELLAIGAASQSEVDAAQMTLNSTMVTRNSTLSQLQVGMLNYKSSMDQLAATLKDIDGNGNVIAPASGTIRTLTAAKNSFVAPSAAVVVIDSTSDMKVSVPVSEALIAKLKVGDTANVSVSAIGAKFDSKITAIEKAANQTTQLYGVSLAIPNEVKGLLSGMFVEAVFYTDSRADTVIIPTESILIAAEGQYVVILDENKVAKRIPVETGLIGNGVTEVTAGLAGGETLVTVGQSYLSDGDGVRIVAGSDKT